MREAGPDRCLLDFRKDTLLAEALSPLRPERFIGAIYRPETERISHSIPAALGRQFDAYLWFEVTRAVEPLPAMELEAMPETYPFAL